jgi:hypothetical protein
VGPRAGLDAVVKKIQSPCRDSNLRSTSPQSTAIPLRYLGYCKGRGGKAKHINLTPKAFVTWCLGTEVILTLRVDLRSLRYEQFSL